MGLYNICFNADNNYTEQIGVAIASILKNSEKDEKFNFFVLDGGFSDKSKKEIQSLSSIKDFKITYIKMNKEEFKNCPLLKDYNPDFKHFHVPISGYFRFKMGSIFSELDKILYLDCDLLVLGSLKELYNTDVGEYYTAMVPDVESENEAERLDLPVYCNAGVMLINLKKWRKDKIEEKLFDYAQNNKEKILWQDQDVLNVVLKDGIKTLPRKWNFQFFQYDPSRYQGLYEKYHEFSILHFAGRFKPWTYEVSHPLFQEYYDYLRITPWKDKLVEYKKKAYEKFFASDMPASAIVQELDKIKEFVQEKINQEFKKFNDSFENLRNGQLEERLSEIDENRNYIAQIKEKLTGIDENKNNIAQILESQTKNVKRLQDIISEVQSKLYVHSDEKDEEITNKLLVVESDLYKYIDEKKEEVLETLFAKEAELYKHSDDRKNEALTIIYEIESKLYSFIEEQIKSVSSSFLDAESKLYEYNNNKHKDAIYKINEVESRLYELTKESNARNNECFNKLENKISEVEQGSRADLHLQKEFFARLLQTKTDNLKSFFEESLKIQVETLSKTYEDIASQQKAIYEENLKTVEKNKEEQWLNKFESQKSWYENELYSQKQKFELEVQKQINEVYSSFNSELSTKLDEQKVRYEKLLDEKQEVICCLENKNKEIQDRLNSVENEKSQLETSKNECQNYIKHLEEEKSVLADSYNDIDKKYDELNKTLVQKQNEFDSLVSELEGLRDSLEKLKQEKEEDSCLHQRQISDLIEEYEEKMKPFSIIRGLVDGKKNSKK